MKGLFQMDSFNSLKGRNLTMLVDFYEMTMANGYLKNGMGDAVAYFDMFFRKVPDGGGYVIMAGVEQLCEYLKGLEFTPEDIEYLRGRGFSEEFLDYLADFKFSCDVYAVPEGTPIFPGEPIVTVKGPIMQAQFVETMVLLCINHQSLIATKANRIVRAAQGRPIMEFGSRRAQGFDAAIYGARAAYIGGCAGTACAVSDIMFGEYGVIRSLKLMIVKSCISGAPRTEAAALAAVTPGTVSISTSAFFSFAISKRIPAIP